MARIFTREPLHATLIRAENPSHRGAARLGLVSFVWLLPMLLACVAFGAMIATQPRLHATYTPDTLATAPDIDSQRGFYDTEVDTAGNRFVWTQERATVVFNFLVQK